MAGKTLQSTVEISGVLSPSLQKAIKAAVDRLDEMSDEMLDSMGAAAKLAAEMDTQESVLKNLKRGYADYVVAGEESSEQAQELAQRIQKLSGELNENRQTLRNAEKAADALGESLEEAGEDAESSSEGYTILKGAIAELAADGIEAAVDAFKELATEGDNALAMLEAKTGSTAAELEGFEDVMYEVYNANYGESLGDVSETLSTVIQMTDDLDNASLANVTKSAIALEDVFGFDTVESLRAVNSLMDQFGITSEQAYNLIVQGAQNGLNQNDDLLDTINEYSVQFRNAGYTADDMFNMLANGVESGTWSVDKLGDAVKEFNIRMSDGSAQEAVEALGFSWEAVSESWSKGGDEAKDVFNMLINELDGLENTTEGYNIGVGLLGTMYEDLGQEAVLALSQTEGAISSAYDAMAQMDSAAYDTLESSLSQLGRTVKSEVVQPIVEELTPAIKNGVNVVTSKVGPAVDWLLAHLPEVGVALATVSALLVAMNWGNITTQLGKVSGAISGAMSALGKVPGPVLAVIAVVAALAAGFIYLWKTNEDFRDNVMVVWEQLQASFSELGGTISSMLDQLMPLISELASTVLTAFGQIAAAVLPVLVELVGALLPVIIDMINQILPLLMQVISAVLPVLVQLIQTLLPVITQIVEAVLPVLVQLINAVLPILTQIINAVLPVLVQVLNTLTPILNMVISLLQPILNLIINMVTPILNLIMTAITPLIEIFGTLINAVLQPIMPILSAVANVITTVLGAAIQAIQPIIQSLTNVFQGLIDFITGVFSGNWSQAWNGVVQVFGGLWDSLVGIVKAPINAVIGLINKAIGALNGISVTIPDWVPVVGGNTFGINIPTIPMLASGGFTEGVSIAGEEGMEAVISFDPAYHEKNVGIWERAGQLLGVLGNEEQEAPSLASTAGKLLELDDFSLGTLATDNSMVIYYDFSGFTWSPQIQNEGKGDDADSFMAKLKAHEAEFFDWLEEFVRMREVAQYA